MSVNYGSNLVSYMKRVFTNKSNAILTINFNFENNVPIIKSSLNNDIIIDKTPFNMIINEDNVCELYLALYQELKEICCQDEMSIMGLSVIMNLSIKEPALLIEIKEPRNNKMYILLDNYKLAKKAIHEISNDWEEMLQSKNVKKL